MYAVIFKARINKTGQDYLATAKRMRDKALQYGCSGFESATENGFEISISYWQSLQQIADWKNDPEHRQAQAQGKSKWYKNYSVEIVEIKKSYKG